MIKLDHLTIAYDRVLLKEQSIMLYPGQITCISGESGVGKTSLLYRIGLISNQMDYEMSMDGVQLHQLSEKEISRIRREDIGFVLQEKDLIDHLDVSGSLMHFAKLTHTNIKEEDISSLLAMVSLHVSHHQNVMTLSLGERQRLAIACALVKQPRILILDEPTASLDEINETLICEILKRLAHEAGKYIIVASHSERVIASADWVYRFQQNQLMLEKEGKEVEIQHSYTSCSSKTSFAFDYVKAYLQHYRIFQVFMIGMMVVVMTLSNGLNVFLQGRLKEEKDILYSQFDKQLFVTMSQESNYIDKTTNPMLKPDTKEESIPYIKAVSHEYPEIEVVPYFDQTNFEDKLVSRMNSGTKGIYVSDGARSIIANTLDTYKDTYSLSIDLIAFEHQQRKTYTLDYHTAINGLLKKGVQCHYTNDGKPYIYVYYQDLLALYKDVSNAESYAGFTYLYDNYDELEQSMERLETSGYHVNSEFIELESIQSIMNYYTSLKERIIAVLYILSSIMMIAVCMYMFYKRKKELAILKLNGAYSMELIHLFIIEYAIEYGIGAVIGLLLSSIISVYFHVFDYQMIGITLGILLIPFSIALLNNAILIRRIKVEQELR